MDEEHFKEVKDLEIRKGCHEHNHIGELLKHANVYAECRDRVYPREVGDLRAQMRGLCSDSRIVSDRLQKGQSSQK